MRFLSHYLLRSFIFLLLTVFIANTVYASGVMTADQLHALADHKTVHCPAASSVASEQHCHNQHQHKHSCNDCNHCFACFTVIIPNHFSSISNPDQSISVMTFAEIYLSPTSVQPQKPPIV